MSLLSQIPSLVELTYTAYDCILKEVTETAKSAVVPGSCEYVIIAGIQVHGPNGQNFYWPGHMTKWVNGTVSDLSEEYFSAVSDWHTQLQGWSASEALMLLQKRRREARLAAKTGDISKLTRIGISLDGVRDNHQRTLLHVAAKYNAIDVAKHLVEKHPALVEQKDLHHFTPLDYAVHAKNDVIANLLFKAGAGLTGEVLRAGLTQAVEMLDLSEFGRYVRYAKNQEEALAAEDKDGRSLVHICVQIKEQQVTMMMMMMLLTMMMVMIMMVTMMVMMMQVEKVRQQEEMISSLLSLGVDSSMVDHFGNDVRHNAEPKLAKMASGISFPANE